MENATGTDVVPGFERTRTSDICVGIAIILLSLICAIAYAIILTTIYRDKELFRMTSYKLMFLLGIFDVVQCLPHAVTGFFTIYQTTWTYWLAKLMGVLATPFYVSYSVMTLILSFNRLIQFLSPQMEARLFSKWGLKLWSAFAIMCCVAFMAALSSPWASIVYYPDLYSWDYDYTLNGSAVVQKVEEVIEVGGIFISGVIYFFVAILLYYTRKRFAASQSFMAELKILIQAFVVTLYCSILNVFWHNSSVLLPDTLVAYAGLNFMWIANSGIHPLIYFIVNSVLRHRISLTGKKAKTLTIGRASMILRTSLHQEILSKRRVSTISFQDQNRTRMRSKRNQGDEGRRPSRLSLPDLKL